MIIPRLKIILLFCIPVILLSMTAIASYALYKIHSLSLPISEYLALFAIILPTVASTVMLKLRGLLRKSWNNNYQPLTLQIFALITMQFIFETIIITLSLTHIFPSSTLTCGLVTRWEELYQNNNERALQAIQDNLNCCGLKSVRDRSWPISRNSPSSCSEIFGRSQSCLVPWRRAEQFFGAMILVNAIFVLCTKVFAIVFIIKKSDNSIRNILAIEESEPGENTEVGFGRLLVKDNNPSNAFRDAPEPIESANEGAVDWNSNQNSTADSTQVVGSKNHWDSDGTNN